MEAAQEWFGQHPGAPERSAVEDVVLLAAFDLVSRSLPYVKDVPFRVAMSRGEEWRVGTWDTAGPRRDCTPGSAARNDTDWQSRRTGSAVPKRSICVDVRTSRSSVLRLGDTFDGTAQRGQAAMQFRFAAGAGVRPWVAIDAPLGDVDPGS